VGGYVGPPSLLTGFITDRETRHRPTGKEREPEPGIVCCIPSATRRRERVSVGADPRLASVPMWARPGRCSSICNPRFLPLSADGKGCGSCLPESIVSPAWNNVVADFQSASGNYLGTPRRSQEKERATALEAPWPCCSKWYGNITAGAGRGQAVIAANAGRFTARRALREA